MPLGLGLGLGHYRVNAGPSGPSGPVNAAPTDIALSNSTVPEDLAVGLSVGTLSTTDPDAGDSVTYSIVTDADGKFAISGDQLTVGVAFDYETKTSHAVTVRATDAGGLTFDKEFTITIEDVDEVTVPDLPSEDVTLIFEGEFDVDPVISDHNGKPKVQGKVRAIASVILDIGALVAGATYIAQYDPDFSLLSNTGKDAMVGFGLKSGNSFHLTGLKGDGSTGLNQAKVYGNWNGLSGATVISSVAAQNGTQAGPNWLKIAVAADGTTYTLSTSANGTDWSAEYTAAVPTPLTNADDATTFGIAIFFPATDIGQFSMTLDVWQVSIAHRYWRLDITTNGGDTDYVTIAHFELRATNYSANLAVGGTVAASSDRGVGWVPTRAVDGSRETAWSTGGADPTGWISYDLGAGNEAAITTVGLVMGVFVQTDRMVGSFDLQYSDNNVDWTTLWSSPTWSFSDWYAQDCKIIDSTGEVATKTLTGAQRYWRIFEVAGNSTSQCTMGEIELRTSVGGPTVTGSGTGVQYNFAATSVAGSAWDGNYANETSIAGEIGNVWKYDFGVGNEKDIIEVQLTCGSNAARAIKTCKVQCSDDNVFWTDVWTISNQTGWSAFESRVFTKP